MFASGFVIDAATPGLGYGGDIVLMAAFPEMFLAIYLLADFDGWTLAARAAVKRWVRQMIDAQRPLMFYKGYAMYNNWEDHRLEYLATGALAIDDADLLLDVFARWREILPMKMTDEGMLPREAERTRSMQYHLFALNAMATVAEIGRQTGVELYDLTIDGRCMKKAVDYVAGHLLAMDGWPHEMIEPLETKPDLSVFELAYARWGDGRYLRVIDTWGGRPVGPVATLMTTRA